MEIALVGAIGSILFLVVLHELGHFVLAKKFGVRAEEFGIGLPFTPALFKKKIGATVYSLYPLLIGAFVRLLGEEKHSTDPASFSAQSVKKRLLIVGGGVASSWLVAAVILALVGTFWAPWIAVPENSTLFGTTHVQIASVALDSPAEQGGLLPGDVVLTFATADEEEKEIDTIAELQKIADDAAGKEVRLNVLRGEAEVIVSIVPRATPPDGEGAMGVALVNAGKFSFPWYQAPYQGIRYTILITGATITETVRVVADSITNEDAPPLQEQVVGPVGIVSLLQSSLDLGIEYFLLFVAQIAILLAIFNTVPIPALDGGRMVFLIIEAIRKKPLPERFVQSLIVISFLLLLPLIIWVSINDIQRFF